MARKLGYQVSRQNDYRRNGTFELEGDVAKTTYERKSTPFVLTGSSNFQPGRSPRKGARLLNKLCDILKILVILHRNEELTCKVMRS